MNVYLFVFDVKQKCIEQKNILKIMQTRTHSV
jgi:hypothetical protein